jgi:hypothetical protein
MIPLLCHHKKVLTGNAIEKRMRAGICHDQTVMFASNGLAGSQAEPVIMAIVTWDESFLNPESGETQYPDDDKRFPAMMLISANDLVFDGPYEKDEDLDDDTQEAVMVSDYLKEKSPDVYQQIIEAINVDETVDEPQEAN